MEALEVAGRVGEVSEEVSTEVVEEENQDQPGWRDEAEVEVVTDSDFVLKCIQAGKQSWCTRPAGTDAECSAWWTASSRSSPSTGAAARRRRGEPSPRCAGARRGSSLAAAFVGTAGT